jgi:hypothetical protein
MLEVFNADSKLQEVQRHRGVVPVQS